MASPFQTFLFLLGVLMSTTVIAGEAIETNAFRITLPVGWSVNLKSKPVSAVGKDGEFLQLSAASISGSGTPEEAARILLEMEANATKTIQQGASDPRLVSVSPLTKSKLASGASLQEMVSRTKDGQLTFAQFAVTGPRSVLLVTLEVPSKRAAAAIPLVRTSLAQTIWIK